MVQIAGRHRQASQTARTHHADWGARARNRQKPSAAAVDSRHFLPSAASIPPQAVRAQDQPARTSHGRSMELPPQLRQAIDRALDGVALTDLAAAAATLSQRYREERRDGALYVASRRDALAYVAVRMPATYAAVRASFDA